MINNILDQNYIELSPNNHQQQIQTTTHNIIIRRRMRLRQMQMHVVPLEQNSQRNNLPTQGQRNDHSIQHKNCQSGPT